MQPIVFVILCLWALYSSQKFIPFSIKAFVREKLSSKNKSFSHIFRSFTEDNADNTFRMFKPSPVNITIPLREPTIIFPKIYFDDINQIIMLFI
jgi:hypothetical protein